MFVSWIMIEYFRNHNFQEFVVTTFQDGKREPRSRKNIQNERKKDSYSLEQKATSLSDTLKKTSLMLTLISDKDQRENRFRSV